MQLFIILVVAVSIFLLLIKLLGSVTARLSERMVTYYFRAVEALLERDRLPQSWGDQLAAMAKRGSVRQWFIYVIPWRDAAKPYLMKKVCELHKYFTRCPFMESPEVRELLLKRLDAVIERWDSMELSGILSQYQVAVDVR